ncbi:MAG: dihydroorotase-like protein [Alphaproteobacteria bacterium]|nr:MAG: dihydroorotase-like protein [Alphaproteobacteria bacterium]
MIDLLIRNGLLVDPVDGVYAGDIGVQNGRIAAIYAPGFEPAAREAIDASGKYVFPGVIEPHTHMGFKRSFAEDVRSESGAAAIGGITTFMSFHRHYQSARPMPYDDFPELRETIEQESHIDMGIHLGILTESQLRELERYIDWGVSSFKFYMAYRGADGKTVGMINEIDDGVMFEGFQVLGRHPHTQACVHCENTEIIARHVARARAEGRDSLAAWNAARPAFAEAEHVRRAGFFAELTGANLYYVHIGAEIGLEEALRHRERYDRLTVETCPHYLMVCEDDDHIGNLAKVNPPVRTAADRERMWSGLANGEIATVGTDHCATTRAQKGGTIWEAAAGFPGMTTLLPVLLSDGYHKRGLPLQRIAQVTSYNVARAFNMPHKGTLRVGADADLAIVDLDLEQEVRPQDYGSASDFSILEGQKLKGWPLRTILRGKTVAIDGRLVGSPGDGSFVAR